MNKGRSYRPTIFQIFLFYFPTKTGKVGEAGNISKNCIINRAQNILEGFAFQYLEIKFGTYGNMKNCTKKMQKI